MMPARRSATGSIPPQDINSKKWFFLSIWALQSTFPEAKCTRKRELKERFGIFPNWCSSRLHSRPSPDLHGQQNTSYQTTNVSTEVELKTDRRSRSDPQKLELTRNSCTLGNRNLGFMASRRRGEKTHHASSGGTVQGRGPPSAAVTDRPKVAPTPPHPVRIYLFVNIGAHLFTTFPKGS